MGIETVEAVRPFNVRDAEPGIHGEQTVEVESRGAALAVARSADEAGPLKHLEVLGDGRLCQRRGLCELDDAGIAGRKALQDRPASWVCESGEGSTEGVIGRHNY
jgi:hypothetical protein